MILRILKSNQPLNYILVVIFGLMFWTESLINPHHYPFYRSENENILFNPIDSVLKNSPIAEAILSLALALILAYFVQHINSRYSFIRIRTMLPAPMFILLIGGFKELHTIHPVYFAALFLLLAIHRLFSVFESSKPYSSIFDAGFWLGVGSLFYLNLVVLFPAFLISVAILSRNYRWRIFVVNSIGYFLPFFFAFSYAILTGQFLELLKIMEINLVSANNHFKSNVPLQIFLLFLILLTLIGSIKMIEQYDTKKISSRKYFTAFFLIFTFSLSGFVLIPSTSVEILIITAIPVCFLVSNFLVFMKSRFWSELIITLLFGLVVFMQILKF